MSNGAQITGGRASRVVFVGDRDGNDEIYSMDSDGSNETRLTNDARPDGRPSWDVDSDAILFDRDFTIWEMNADGSGQRELIARPGSSKPVVSPDGTELLFASVDANSVELFVANRDGSNIRKLTSLGGFNGEASRSSTASGEEILFNCSGRICSITPDGENFTQLTAGPRQGWPVRLPGGELAYHQDVGTMGQPEYHLFVDATDLGPGATPAFCGTVQDLFILFQRPAGDGTNKLYRANLDGTEIVEIGSAAGNNFMPACATPPAPEPLQSLKVIMHYDLPREPANLAATKYRKTLVGRGFPQTGPICGGGPPPSDRRSCGLGDFPDLLNDTGPDSVYLHSGEYYLAAADLEVPGRGFSWKLERRYRSGVRFDGPLGHNWDFNYNRKLVEASTANLAVVQAEFPAAQAGDVVRVDGYTRADLYRRSPDGTYAAPTGYYTRLTKATDGTYAEMDRSATRVDYAAPDVSGVARMTALVDRNANTMRFTYDAAGRLVRVHDTLGRPIDYRYDAEGRVTDVEDFAGRSVRFVYDARGDLVSVTGPAVTGTPTGNDFPDGKTTRYSYASGFADERFNHNLLTITAPNEVASGGPPRLVLSYETDPASPNADRVLTQTAGGTNATGVPAGGTIVYEYVALSDAAGGVNVPVAETIVMDRNGNRTEYEFNSAGQIVFMREHTNRDVRPGDPSFFETRYEYNADGEILRRVAPEGSVSEYLYDADHAERSRHGNVVSERRHPDAARGGDQSFVAYSYEYEPIYNQVRRVVDPRGNDPSYVPQNGGSTDDARYSATYVFDYQEGANVAALAAKLGVSETRVQDLLEGLPMSLGDLNGDGRTDQVAGNVVMIEFPTVRMLPGSRMSEVEEGTGQPVAYRYAYDEFGQITREVDPEGNVVVFSYYPADDPDGDGGDLVPGAPAGPFGYLKEEIRDAESGASRNSKTDPVPSAIYRRFGYDPAGNVTTQIDGRGVATAYRVNQLNQIVEVSRGDAHDMFAADPPEPVELTDFDYLQRFSYDFNDNLSRVQTEDRGNTSGVGGDNPETAFVDSVHRYDILNQLVETSQEVSDVEDVVARFRYDPNGNGVLSIAPEGNASAAFYDERDLLFRATRGATAVPAAALMAPGDPTDLDVRGGTPSSVTYTYDGNRNPVEVADADDTDLSVENNSGLGGDRTRLIYDGFDRLTSAIDAAGNQTVVQYDPLGNRLRISRFGPNGGPSPRSDGPALPRPVSSSGVIQPSALVSDNLLAATETLYDELGRPFQFDQVLFASGPAQREPDVDDGASDVGKQTLTPGDAQPIPGLAGPAIHGRVSTRTEYDRSSRRAFEIEDDGDTSQTLYDGANRVLKTVDPERNTVELAYDDNGNLIEMRETEVPQGRSFAPDVFITTHWYDSLNRVERTVDNAGQSVELRYDSRDNLVATADAQGPAGPVLARRVFPPGPDTVNATNAFGNVTLAFYDGLSRLVREERTLTASGEGDGLHIGADRFGIKTSAPTPDPAQGGGDGIIRTGQTWDESSLPSSSLDDQGNVVVTLYDNLNRPVTVTKGLTTATGNLDASRILGAREVAAPTSSTVDDPVALPRAKLDIQLAASAARVASVTGLFPSRADRVDDDPPTTLALGYDPDDNVLIAEDENDSEIFTRYDAIDRPVARRVFRGGQSDDHSADPLFATAPVSDPSNPSTNLPPVTGSTRQDFEYDGLSRLTLGTDDNEPGPDDDSVIGIGYDSLGRVIEESQKQGALPAMVVSTGWRADALRSSLTYPATGSTARTLVYRYDGLDRLRSVADSRRTTPVVEYDFVGPSRVLERRFPSNSTRLTYTDEAGAASGYDAARRAVQLRHLGPLLGRAGTHVPLPSPTVPLPETLLLGFAQTYDRMSNKRTELKLHNPANSEAYRLDSAYRLVDFERPDAQSVLPLPGGIGPLRGGFAPRQSDWRLDGVANWTSFQASGEQGPIAETRHHSSLNEITERVTSSVTTAVLSDDSGNVVDDGEWLYGWDFANRLRTVRQKSDGAVVAAYSYDVANRRVRKVVTNSGSLDGTTDFSLDGMHEIEERDGANGLLRQYVYGLKVDEPLVLDRNLDGDSSATGEGDQRLFYHQNSLGSVYGLSNGAGALVEAYQYEAFGLHVVFGTGPDGWIDFGLDDVASPDGTSAFDNPFLYTGRRLDPETGLYHYRNRYYSPGQGRFLSRDPIGAGTYTYAEGAPLDWTDPSGLQGSRDECCTCPDGSPCLDPYEMSKLIEQNRGRIPRGWHQQGRFWCKKAEDIGGAAEEAWHWNNPAVGPGGGIAPIDPGRVLPGGITAGELGGMAPGKVWGLAFGHPDPEVRNFYRLVADREYWRSVHLKGLLLFGIPNVVFALVLGVAGVAGLAGAGAAGGYWGSLWVQIARSSIRFGWPPRWVTAHLVRIVAAGPVSFQFFYVLLRIWNKFRFAYGGPRLNSFSEWLRYIFNQAGVTPPHWAR